MLVENHRCFDTAAVYVPHTNTLYPCSTGTLARKQQHAADTPTPSLGFDNRDRPVMSTRRSARLSSPGNRDDDTKDVATTGPAAAPAAAKRGTHEPKNKRVKRETSTTPAAAKPKEEADAESVEGDDGPSAYELQRLAKMKENARMLASLGLSGAKGQMRTAVSNDAAQRAKARGLAPRQPKSYPARSRCVFGVGPGLKDVCRRNPTAVRSTRLGSLFMC